MITVPLLAGGSADNAITIVGVFFFIMVSKPSEYAWTFGSAHNSLLVEEIVLKINLAYLFGQWDFLQVVIGIPVPLKN